MPKRYWLDLFTGKTQEEFLKQGATATVFKERRKNIAQKIKPEDYFICNLTGISRFVGVLEVKSEVTLKGQAMRIMISRYVLSVN